MAMTRCKQWLLLGVIFFSGVVIGVAGTIGVAGVLIKSKIKMVFKDDQTRLVDYMLSKLATGLDLDEEQRHNIKPILARGVADFRILHRDFHVKFFEIFIRTQSDIGRQLNPAQQEKMDRLIKHLQKRIPPLSRPRAG